eukprot:144415_1
MPWLHLLVWLIVFEMYQNPMENTIFVNDTLPHAQATMGSISTTPLSPHPHSSVFEMGEIYLQYQALQQTLSSIGHPSTTCISQNINTLPTLANSSGNTDSHTYPTSAGSDWMTLANIDIAHGDVDNSACRIENESHEGAHNLSTHSANHNSSYINAIDLTTESDTQCDDTFQIEGDQQPAIDIANIVTDNGFIEHSSHTQIRAGSQPTDLSNTVTVNEDIEHINHPQIGAYSRPIDIANIHTQTRAGSRPIDIRTIADEHGLIEHANNRQIRADSRPIDMAFLERPNLVQIHANSQPIHTQILQQDASNSTREDVFHQQAAAAIPVPQPRSRISTNADGIKIFTQSEYKPKEFNRMMLCNIGFDNLGLGWSTAKKTVRLMFIPKQRRSTHQKKKGPDSTRCSGLEINEQIDVIHAELGYIPASID